MRMSLMAIVAVLGVGATATAWAADPPVPSGPHPRLFMRPADVAAYAARAKVPDSAAAKQIARCQRTIDMPHEFKERGASFVKELSFIDDGLWGFEVTDADGYVLAFFRRRDE